MTYPVKKSTSTHFEKEYVEELLKNIKRLQAERDELAAKNLIMRSHLQIAYDCINGADETGYVDDVGFVDFEALSLDLKALIESTPQQSLRDVQAEAVLKFAKYISETGELNFGDCNYILSEAFSYSESLRKGGAE